MSSGKLVREFRRHMKRLGVRVVECRNLNGHYHVKVEHADGRVQPLTLASSPRDMNNTLMRVVGYVKTFAAKAA